MALAKKGFTLLELLLVVIILAILAAITVPQVVESSREAQVASAQASLHAIRIKLDEQYQLTGEWPTKIENSWFLGNTPPKSPWKSLHRGEAANTFGDADWIHPRTKITQNHDYPYWYNNLNGSIRIRVPQQGDANTTVAFYNRVNKTNSLNLSQETR